jgi:hypothetical protein
MYCQESTMMARGMARGGGGFGGPAAFGVLQEMEMVPQAVAFAAPPAMKMMKMAVKKPIEVRKTFPETWLFDSFEFGSK